MARLNGTRPEISVVVPVLRRGTDPEEIFRRLGPELDALTESWEFVFVADGQQVPVLDRLRRLVEEQPRTVSALVLSRPQGEAAALTAGFREARAETIVTLGSHLQVEPAGLGSVVRALRTSDADMVVGRRYPRQDGSLPKLQTRFYHWMVRLLTDTSFHDISCGLRAMTRQVADDLELYGDLHRFIPVLATSQGFVVREVDVAQSPEDRPRGIYGPGSYARRLLDSLSLFFLVRFTQRPLRFFGMIGLLLSVPGFLITLYLGAFRLLGVGAIADRPLLLLGLLLLVMGAQSASIGLLGELIIFTHSRARRAYRVAEIFEGGAPPPADETERDSATAASASRASGAPSDE